jgi:hypothetical protein
MDEFCDAGCTIEMLYNGVCDEICNTPACLHDLGSCDDANAATLPQGTAPSGACAMNVQISATSSDSSSGWTNARGACVKLLREPRLFSECESACEDAGGVLATVQTSEQLEAMLQLIDRPTYIGLVVSRGKARFISDAPVHEDVLYTYKHERFGNITGHPTLSFFRGRFVDSFTSVEK